ncbi:Hsp70 family protein [Cellulomonas humilata]|uniref:Hsp70 family protein n=2 Tax=Cellulomonas humilata TaxID=144055 RepID=A0A7Y6DXF1_9CELL|nr:Hsp70 family protein [Cellulomonas humilata]
MGDSTSWMPSVASPRGADLIVGEDALRQSPGSLIRSVKRCITTGATTVCSADKSFERSADEVIGAVLTELASRAQFERLPISEPGTTRLGCPAMWDADQRLRLLNLASAAGFAVGASTLIDEPVAAGLMWITEQTRRAIYLDGARVLVFDMGGGTLDVAILDVTTSPDRDPEIYVLASAGVDEAGDVLDTAIAKNLEDILGERDIFLGDLPDEGLARAYLDRAATEAKIALTDVSETDIDVAYAAVQLPRLHYSVEQLDDALRPQMERAWSLVESTLRAAYLTREGPQSRASDLRKLSAEQLTSKITHVLLTGGMSRVPGVARFLGPRFANAVVHQDASIRVQESIAAGLAENTTYERVNLHLPGFDFVLDYIDRDGTQQTATLYRAHTRFYEPWEAMSRDRLYYSWPDGATAYRSEAVRDLPDHGSGAMRVVALDGSPVTLRHGDDEVDRLRVDFGLRDVRFTLAPDGSLTLTDGRLYQQTMRVDRWPALRSGFGRLALNIEKPRWVPMERRAYDTK